jgi:hypothetical protein
MLHRGLRRAQRAQRTHCGSQPPSRPKTAHARMGSRPTPIPHPHPPSDPAYPRQPCRVSVAMRTRRGGADHGEVGNFAGGHGKRRAWWRGRIFGRGIPLPPTLARLSGWLGSAWVAFRAGVWERMLCMAGGGMPCHCLAGKKGQEAGRGQETLPEEEREGTIPTNQLVD